MSISLYGVGISPYVRKVRMALALKELEYEHILVLPGSPDQPEAFKENSPLGKIPLAQIDGHWLPSSSVILAYLEKTQSDHPLLSDDPVVMAKQLWWEEYAASKMTAVIGGHLFAELILAPHFFKREANQEEIDLARSTEIPEIFDYLESELKTDFLTSDTISHADVCVGSPIFTLSHCGETCDAARWPKTAAYIMRIMTHPKFMPIFEDEKAFMAAAMAG